MRRSSRLAALFLIGTGLVLFCGSSVAAPEVTYDSGKRRDPFVPLPADEEAASSSSAGVKLEGIIYDPAGQSMAVLSGKTYQVGDVVGEATVLKIQKELVVISFGDEEKTLRLREEDPAS